MSFYCWWKQLGCEHEPQARRSLRQPKRNAIWSAVSRARTMRRAPPRAVDSIGARSASTPEPQRGRIHHLLPYWNASIDTILAFRFFLSKWLTIRFFGTFANEIRFIVSKMVTQKSRLSDSNLPAFWGDKRTMTLILKISVIVKDKCHRD